MCFQLGGSPRRFCCGPAYPFIILQSPHRVKVFFQIFTGRIFCVLRPPDQNVPVIVGPLHIIPQEQVVGVASAQDIQKIIHDQILVMQTVAQLPGSEQVDGVIKPHLHIRLHRQSMKGRAADPAVQAVDAVNDDLYFHAAPGCGLQGCHHIPSAAVIVKIEGGKDDPVLCSFNGTQPPDQRLRIGFDIQDPLAGVFGRGFQPQCGSSPAALADPGMVQRRQYAAQHNEYQPCGQQQSDPSDCFSDHSIHALFIAL